MLRGSHKNCDLFLNVSIDEPEKNTDDKNLDEQNFEVMKRGGEYKKKEG